MTVFIGGKMKRVRRPQQIDGMDADEFIRRNADPLWLHQNEMWEDMEEGGVAFAKSSQPLKTTPDEDIS